MRSSITFLLASVLFIAGCEQRNPVANLSDEGPNMNANKFVFEGHTYIFFRSSVDARQTGVVHDPDCPKCKAEKL